MGALLLAKAGLLEKLAAITPHLAIDLLKEIALRANFFSL